LYTESVTSSGVVRVEEAEVEMDVDGVPLDKLTMVYIKMRDKRSELKRNFDNEDGEIQEEMKLLEAQMLEACKSISADSIRTKAGTIIRSTKTRYWTNDWDSMRVFIKDHDAFDLLERRLHQTNMKQFLEENPEVLPIGLNTDREFTIVVRRAKQG
jgi:hypothetical protein